MQEDLIEQNNYAFNQQETEGNVHHKNIGVSK